MTRCAWAPIHDRRGPSTAAVRGCGAGVGAGTKGAKVREGDILSGANIVADLGMQDDEIDTMSFSCEKLKANPHSSWRMHESNLTLEKANLQGERSRTFVGSRLLKNEKNGSVPPAMSCSSGVCSF